MELVGAENERDGDNRLNALSEEIARIRRAGEPPKPAPPQPTDLEGLAQAEVSKVLASGETLVAEGLAFFGPSEDAPVLVLILTTLIAPIAGLLGLATRRHWWIVLTNKRFMVFRLFEAQATFPDSGMALQHSVALPHLVINKTKKGRLSVQLHVVVDGESYRFRFPSKSAGGEAIINRIAAATA